MPHPLARRAPATPADCRRNVPHPALVRRLGRPGGLPPWEDCAVQRRI